MILIGIAIVGLICVVELTQVVAAKLADVKVCELRWGFGPNLFQFQIGETIVRIAAIPLGCTSKRLGEKPTTSIPSADYDRAFFAKPLWVQAWILLSGPIVCLILPYLLYFTWFVGQTQVLPPVVGTVLKNSPAATAGLEQGDRITAIDGTDIRSWHELERTIRGAAHFRVRLQIERDKRRFDRFVIPSTQFLGHYDLSPTGYLGILPWAYLPQIGIVDLDSPAAEAGLQTGDVITSINGEVVRTIEDLEQILVMTQNVLIRLTYLHPHKRNCSLGTCLIYSSHHAKLLIGKSGNTHTGLLSATTFIKQVQDNSSGGIAGIKPGDRIVSANHQPLHNWESLTHLVTNSTPKDLELEVQSPGQTIRNVSLDLSDDSESTSHNLKGELGLTPFGKRRFPQREQVQGQFNFALENAWHQAKQTFSTIFSTLGHVFFLRPITPSTPRLSPQSLVAGVNKRVQPLKLLTFISLIAAAIGLVCLLPIYPLPGGRLLDSIWWKISNHPPSPFIRYGFITLGILGLTMTAIIILGYI